MKKLPVLKSGYKFIIALHHAMVLVLAIDRGIKRTE